LGWTGAYGIGRWVVGLAVRDTFTGGIVMKKVVFHFKSRNGDYYCQRQFRVSDYAREDDLLDALDDWEHEIKQGTAWITEEKG